MPGAISAIASGAASARQAPTSASSSDETPSDETPNDETGGRNRLFRGAEGRRLRDLLGLLLAAHPAVDEGWRRVVRRRDRLGQAPALGREVTDRVGGRRVAGQREGLAAAAAPIYLAALARAAGLEHPIGPAEPVEGVGFAPDLGQAHVS